MKSHRADDPGMCVGVLVVDDQAAFRDAAAEIASSIDGFCVVGTAATGEESIEVSKGLRPDLVVMDVRLPGIDGVEATRRIRETHPDAVVVLVSTYDEYAAETDSCGAAAFILKDVLTPERLASAWRSATSL